jgi:hypothetical protein
VAPLFLLRREERHRPRHDRGGAHFLAFVVPLSLDVAAFFIAGMRERERD